ncbi:MAG: DUF1572 family protein [Puia sp.]
MENNYISSVKNQFKQAKIMAEKAIDQIPDEKIYWQFNPVTNSIAIIVKHLAGNMLSRFTDFYTSDGEKKWRDRDAEFENEHLSRESLKALWDKGWDCLFQVLNGLSASDLSKVVVIRNEELTVIDAITRN